ncbi:MAG TPA: hypothetical protein VJ579_03275 [Candidatus Paceibacterota bacterium]|nr:hypothetical protein [Candidatus Paceibacterota bacterium]
MRLSRHSLTLFIAGILLAPLSSFAVAVKPAQVEQKIDPGTVKTFTMSVTNNDNSQQTFYPVVRNVTGVNDQNQPLFEKTDNGQPHDLTLWLQFDKSPITVAPKQTASILVTAEIPKDASPGSHIAGFFFSDKPIIQTNILGASVGFDVGAIVHFQISGDSVTKANVRHFSTDHSIYGKPPIDFSVAIENEGNTLVRPIGMIDITNMMGRKVASLPVNDTGAGVFPKTTREWKATWAPNEVVFGKFTALVALAVETEQGTDTLIRQVVFWVLPTNIILPTFFGFGIFLLISYVLLRIYVRRQIGEARKGKTNAAEGLSVFASVLIAVLLAIIIGFLVIFFYFG